MLLRLYMHLWRYKRQKAMLNPVHSIAESFSLAVAAVHKTASEDSSEAGGKSFAFKPYRIIINQIGSIIHQNTGYRNAGNGSI